MNRWLSILFLTGMLASFIPTYKNLAQAADVNLIPNPSVEISNSQDPQLPKDWEKGYLWGNLDAQYQYDQTGQNGTRSVSVNVSRYVSGDAKWFFTPQRVTPNTSYIFQDYYRSNVITDLILMVISTSGQTSYIELGNTPIANSWSVLNKQFVTPSNAYSVSLYHVIRAQGFLATDNFLLKTVTGFNRALVSLTFDDSWGSAYQNALPILQAHGMHSTQYTLVSALGTSGYMTVQQVQAFKNAGHEIASHGIDHLDLTTLTPTQITYQLSESRRFIQEHFGVTPTNYASPYGAYNSSILQLIRPYYRSHRTVDMGFNSRDNLDPYRLLVQNMTVGTTLAEFTSWLDAAKQNKTWLIIVYHQVDTSGGAYSVTPANLTAQLNAIQARNIVVRTVAESLQEVSRLQKEVAIAY